MYWSFLVCNSIQIIDFYMILFRDPTNFVQGLFMILYSVITPGCSKNHAEHQTTMPRSKHSKQSLYHCKFSLISIAVFYLYTVSTPYPTPKWYLHHWFSSNYTFYLNLLPISTAGKAQFCRLILKVFRFWYLLLSYYVSLCPRYEYNSLYLSLSTA